MVIWLSIPTVLNLASVRQLMNYSYDPLDLVNTYGAFGTIGRERDEIVFEGTDDSLITGDTKWKEYEFKAKPGDPNRRPPFVAPYQPRIDWQIWFAAMSSPSEYPWTLHFVWKLLQNDRGTLSLITNNQFPDAPPYSVTASARAFTSRRRGARCGARTHPAARIGFFTSTLLRAFAVFPKAWRQSRLLSRSNARGLVRS